MLVRELSNIQILHEVQPIFVNFVRQISLQICKFASVRLSHLIIQNLLPQLSKLIHQNQMLLLLSVKVYCQLFLFIAQRWIVLNDIRLHYFIIQFFFMVKVFVNPSFLQFFILDFLFSHPFSSIFIVISVHLERLLEPFELTYQYPRQQMEIIFRPEEQSAHSISFLLESQIFSLSNRQTIFLGCFLYFYFPEQEQYLVLQKQLQVQWLQQ